MFPDPSYPTKEDYYRLCRLLLPTIHNWQIELGYSFYLAETSGNKDLADKKYVEMHINNFLFAENRFN